MQIVIYLEAKIMKKRIVAAFAALVAVISCVACLAACDFTPDETLCGSWRTEKRIMVVGNSTHEGTTTFNLDIFEDGTLTALKPAENFILTGEYTNGQGTWVEENNQYKFDITFEDGANMTLTGSISKQYLTIKASSSQYSVSETYVMVKRSK